MNTSVYISSERIEAIGYHRSGAKTTVMAYVTEALPEGVMINGKITDASYLSECLAALRTKNPKLFESPSLIVDGSSLLTKRIEVPRLKRSQYLKLVQDEFADSSEGMGDLVSDFHPLPAAGGVNAILACATEKSQVDSYIATFKEAGIKLKSVNVGIQAILSYVASRPELHKVNFVLNIVDGLSILSMIFNKGVNVFISRSRLYSENNDELILDVLNNLSGLIQFNKSENFDDFVFSYYLGLTKEDVDKMSAMSHYPDITLNVLDLYSKAIGAQKLGVEAHFAYLNTQMGDNCINLMRSYQALNKIKKQGRPKRLWIPFLAGIFLLMAIPTAYYFIKTMMVAVKIVEIQNYLNDEEVLAKSAALDEVLAETADYNRINREFNDIMQTESDKSSISKVFLDMVMQVNNEAVYISYFDFNAPTGTMRVNGTSLTEKDASMYVELLSQSKFISVVYYTGYSITGNGECSFSVEILLAVEEEAE